MTFYTFTVFLVGFLLDFTTVRATSDNMTRDIHVLGLIPDTGNVWPAGETIRIASNIALEQVNARPDVLPGYNLVIHWKDTQVKLIK